MIKITVTGNYAQPKSHPIESAVGLGITYSCNSKGRACFSKLLMARRVMPVAVACLTN